MTLKESDVGKLQSKEADAASIPVLGLGFQRY